MSDSEDDRPLKGKWKQLLIGFTARFNGTPDYADLSKSHSAEGWTWSKFASFYFT